MWFCVDGEVGERAAESAFVKADKGFGEALRSENVRNMSSMMLKSVYVSPLSDA